MTAENYKNECALLPEENKKAVANVIAMCPNNPWWLLEDPVEYAKYQVFEPILMRDFSFYHEGLEKLLGRPVFSSEFGLNMEGLRKETNEAIERNLNGFGVSREYVETKTGEAVEMLIEFAVKNNKPVMIIKDQVKK